MRNIGKVDYCSDTSFVSGENLLFKNFVFSKSKDDGLYCFSGNDPYLDRPDILRENKDLVYLKMASVWSENSHCKRKKVGCLIVNDQLIISDGYNGTPSGFDNCCEDKDGNSLSNVVHAEANAITKLARSTQSSYGSTIYVTLSPCFECSKLIIQSGIKRIVFSELYRNTESLPFLLEAGIEIVKLNLEKNDTI